MEGVIDVTDLVEKARSTFVTWATDFAFTWVIAQPGFQWVAWPVISLIFKKSVSAILDAVSKSAVMEAFFLNTAIRKASQAQDYVNAVNFKNSLPKDATDEDYAKAEQAEINSFNSFVRVTT